MQSNFDLSKQRQFLPDWRFAKQKQLIEELVGHEELQKLLKHARKDDPLKDYIDTCELMIRQNGLIDLKENINQIPLILNVYLNSYIISKCSSTETQNLSLGNFENYGDFEVKKRIKGRILDAENFMSLMAEFFCSARFSAYSGSKIAALPESENSHEKTPDFLLTIEDLEKSIAFDCKKIRASSVDRAIKDRITDANRQIKSFSSRQGSMYGIALIDVSEKLKKFLNNQCSFVNELERLEKIISHHIKNQNSSLSGVLLVFDHYRFAETPEQVNELYKKLSITVIDPMPDKLLLFIRSGKFLPHSQPKYKIPPEVVYNLFNNWGITIGVDIYGHGVSLNKSDAESIP